MKSTISGPRSQSGSAYKHRTLFVRPGLGVRFRTTSPASRLRARPKQLEGTTRGKVAGFSKESAARLRRRLFELDYPAGHCFGVALTSAPWCRRSPESAFESLRKQLGKCPAGLLGAVWRKEVTKKGLSHYHLAVWLRSPTDFLSVWGWLTSTWVSILVAGGVCPAVALLSGSKIALGRPSTPEQWRSVARWALAGVNCRFDLDAPKGRRGNLVPLDQASALQYLCDHTSKHKQYQAATTGRAWGLWFGDRLPRFEVPGIDLDGLPPRGLACLRRALGKMSRYWWRDDSAPFGYRWSRPRRFQGGDQVLFRPGAAAALRRLLEPFLAGSSPRPAPSQGFTLAFRARCLARQRGRLLAALVDRRATAPLVHLPDVVREPSWRDFDRP